jgi:hypothetical protein
MGFLFEAYEIIVLFADGGKFNPRGKINQHGGGSIYFNYRKQDRPLKKSA